MRIAFAGNPNSGKTTMYWKLGRCYGRAKGKPDQKGLL